MMKRGSETDVEIFQLYDQPIVQSKRKSEVVAQWKFRAEPNRGIVDARERARRQ